jgi:hypothetical protein
LDRRDELDEEERKAWESGTKDMRDRPEAGMPPAPKPEPKAEKIDDEDDEMEDLEEMRQFMEKQKDGGQRLIVDWTREVGDVARTSHI